MKIKPKKLKRGQTRIEAFHWAEEAKKEAPFVKKIIKEHAKRQPLDRLEAGVAQLEVQMKSYKNAARPDIVEKLKAEREALTEEIAERERMYKRAGVEKRWDGFDLTGLRIIKESMEHQLSLLIRRKSSPEEIRKAQSDIKSLEKAIEWKRKH